LFLGDFMLFRSSLIAMALLAITPSVSAQSSGTAATAASPAWKLVSGTKLTLDAASRVQVTFLQNGDARISVVGACKMTVSPDPMNLATFREWDLVAGSEISLALSQSGQSLKTSRKNGILTLTLVSDNSQSFTPGNANMTIDPDPGRGKP
jgi:hypothetical protein